MILYPLEFEPIYKSKIWGGDNLKRVYKRNLPGNKIGESWELAAHPHGTSVIANGPYKGKTLLELIKENPEPLLGKRIKSENQQTFPLLIKFIDANDRLSVQVHPDNEYAREEKNEYGKTEMWYILEAKPGAKLIYGLKNGTTEETLARAIENSQLELYLNEIEVKKGDIFFIPAGTVHAIGEGILLAEIQQNSDTTYRLYDWDRKGEDGTGRELHIEKALAVIDFNKKINPTHSRPLVKDNGDYTRAFLAACPYFVTEKINTKTAYQLNLSGDRFYILINLAGEGDLICANKNYQLYPGKTYFLPAGLEKVQISGRVEFLLTYIPGSKEEVINSLIQSGLTQEDINTLAGMDNWDK